MDADLERLEGAFRADLRACRTLEEIERVRQKFFGRKSELISLLRTLSATMPESRRARGRDLNRLKESMREEFETARARLRETMSAQRLEHDRLDTTLPARPSKLGTLHPIGQTIEEVIAVFGDMGFVVAEGPDIEDDFHNFVALNFPPGHPARQMHDTFYLQAHREESPLLLRTHTSPVQVRMMLQKTLPIRVIAPGRCYRSDSDQTHTPMFHQVEGLVLDESTHFGHLKSCLTSFVRAFFETEDVATRFRPSYFPFTEPSAEMDIACVKESGRLCLSSSRDEQWMEILGCGMVHPRVLRLCGLDEQRVQGFAFGMGIERLAMLKYGISDLRMFFENDAEWLRHYGAPPLATPSLLGGLRAREI